MAQSIKRMNVAEFRDYGYLQEVNRQFFHPLGIALEVIVDEATGEARLGGIWDSRDDPEGIAFVDGDVDQDKLHRIRYEEQLRRRHRFKALGYVIQER